MKILYYIAVRPNPTIDLGPVDASCALVLCDLSLPDHPIVYVSDAYLALTKYAQSEVLGRNCRFLQQPPQETAGRAASGETDGSGPLLDPNIRAAMRAAVSRNQEIRLEVPNFRRDGHPFVNALTLVPIYWDEEVATQERRRYRYSVGFLCDLATMA